ncbi:hypothetical protein E0K89_006210 [Aquicoccus sp. SCR17]|nr:hypothetical protein [Carideicomes alvinocaridis]
MSGIPSISQLQHPWLALAFPKHLKFGHIRCSDIEFRFPGLRKEGADAPVLANYSSLNDNHDENGQQPGGER